MKIGLAIIISSVIVVVVIRYANRLRESDKYREQDLVK
jgi:hypothetical protein